MALNGARLSSSPIAGRVKVLVRSNLDTRVLVLLDQECTIQRLEGQGAH